MEWIARIISKYLQNPSLSCAFGVIIYRDSDVHVRHLLEEDSYCLALNEISGQKWILLASRSGVRKRIRTMDALRIEHRGTLSRAWQNGQDKQKVLDSLGIHSEDQLPCLLVWTVSGEQAIVQSVKIRGGSTNEAYESLKDSVCAVTEAIDGVSAGNQKNAEGVAAAIQLRLKADLHRSYALSSVPFLSWLIALASGLI